jgi:hypothetical protein
MRCAARVEDLKICEKKYFASKFLQPRLQKMRAILSAVVVAMALATNDICSAADTGFADSEQLAIVCYAGSF